MNELALFAGAGGGLLATKWLLGWRTVCYIENNSYRVKVLKARIRDGLLDDAPIWDDARTFDGRPWCGCVDIVTAGFPCQPFSRAGKQLGERDDRNLWPDTIRIIREVQPRWILLENVPRLLSFDYIRRIFRDLAESGYDCRWDCISASAIGANHQRDRLWIVAYADDCRQRELLQPELKPKCKEASHIGGDGKVQLVAHANGSGFEEYAELNGQAQQDTADWDSQGRHVNRCCDEMAYPDQQGSSEHLPSGTSQDARDRTSKLPSWWAVEPRLGRVADGVAHRVERIAAIGDGQVPAVVRVVWELIGSENY